MKPILLAVALVVSGIITVCSFIIAFIKMQRKNDGAIASLCMGFAGVLFSTFLSILLSSGGPGPDARETPTIPTASETPTPTPEPITLTGATYDLPFGAAPSSEDLDRVGKRIEYPTGRYLDEYQKMYITASKKHSTYVYPTTEGNQSGVTWFVGHGEEVIVIGKKGNFGCIIWWNSRSEVYMSGWVYWSELSEVEPEGK